MALIADFFLVPVLVSVGPDNILLRVVNLHFKTSKDFKLDDDA